MKAGSEIFIVLRRCLTAAGLLLSGHAVADEFNRKWDCWGTYTNIQQAPVSDDSTGWELSVTPNRVTLISAEGQIVGSVARNVRSDQNWLSFEAFAIDHVLIATCRKNDIVLVVDGVPYGLKRGSWTRRSGNQPLWVD